MKTNPTKPNHSSTFSVRRSRFKVLFPLLLLLAALGLAATTPAPAQEYTFTTLAGPDESPGAIDGTGSAARFSNPCAVAVDSAGNVYVADSGNFTIRIGAVACPDAPTINLAVGPVGQLRQLETSPQTAVAWQWRLIRDPSASSAALSAANVRNPTFTPDVADLYVFRLEATNAAGAICIRTLAFTAYAAPSPPPILLTDRSFGVRSNRFGFDVSAAGGQVVVVETSTDLVQWTDPRVPGPSARFYRAVSGP